MSWYVFICIDAFTLLQAQDKLSLDVNFLVPHAMVVDNVELLDVSYDETESRGTGSHPPLSTTSYYGATFGGCGVSNLLTE